MGNTPAALIKGWGEKKKIPSLSNSEAQYLNILYPVNEKKDKKQKPA